MTSESTDSSQLPKLFYAGREEVSPNSWVGPRWILDLMNGSNHIIGYNMSELSATMRVYGVEKFIFRHGDMDFVVRTEDQGWLL